MDASKTRERFCTACLFWIALCLRKGMSAQITYSIAEEVSPGTFVGNLAKDLNLKVSELEGRLLHIVSGSAIKHFEVNLQTGALLVSQRIDREHICSSSPVCIESLEAIVNNPLRMYSVEIKILDMNDNAPVFPGRSQHIRLAESTFIGAKFPLLSADDPDVGSNTVQSYKLSSNTFFKLEVHKEADQGPSAELMLHKALDREKQAAINLILTAVDGGNPPRSGTTELIIDVLDANDNAPEFSKSVYKVQVSENTPIGTPVLTVTASDADEGVNGELIYTFKQGQRGIFEKFAINQSTGVITTLGKLDYEETGAYELRVEAHDRGHTPLASHCKVLVEILDVNDNPPDIKLSSLLENVREDAKKGTAIALITVQDRDGGKNGHVHCSIPDGIPFLLESSQGKYYSLVLGGTLDRETNSEYNITVTATDEGTPPLTSTSCVVVHVSDVNDNAPHFPENVINVYVRENTPVGTSILSLTAYDLDANENAQVTYSLLENNVNGMSVYNIVAINSVTGEVNTMLSFNYEDMKQWSFQVQAKDAGIPPLNSNATVNICILDENDNSPVFLPPYSDQGSVNSESIPYSAEAGYFVAKIRAVDADSGYNALLSYHISEAKGTNLFRIGTSSGEIRTKRRMSDNDLKTHPLIITVSDQGEPSLSVTVSVEIVVVESTGDAQFTFKTIPLKEETLSDLNLYLLIAIASVSAIFLISLITLIAVKCHRTDGIFSSCSAPMITTHPDGSWSYSKTTQQYDVCFSSDTLKSDVVVFPSPFPPADAELISIDGADTCKRTQTLPRTTKVRCNLSSDTSKMFILPS
ncbi:protocadherin alpha-1-like [Alosa sapidissima]|uniref:protocadherin alpha-1-like n=1 Tax=Alosa sapidissima TaxID=34773 RepID=UPI001C091E18|nr:protocadherin alpha-1-like [Alosa sapidissima]